MYMICLHILYMFMRLFISSKIIHDFIEMVSSIASGSSLLIQIQIAIVGIIIVLGVFLIWRTLSRMEQRIRIVEVNQKTLSQCQAIPSLNVNGNSPITCSMTSGVCLRQDPNIKTFSTATSGEFSEIDDFADEMVKVFGNPDINDLEDLEGSDESEDADGPVKTATATATAATKSTKVDPMQSSTTTEDVVITPVMKPSSKNAVQLPSPSALIDEVLSEADTESGNPLSKSKLKTMNLEKLKAICVHHNISSEGPKSTLISRILGEIRD